MLWKLRFTPPTERERLIRDTKLALMIQFWFPFALIPQTRAQGTWCDGIVLLKVTDLERTAFMIGGVGYFPDSLAPFELEFHYRNRRDLLTKHIVLRLGESQRSGRPPAVVFNRRPQANREWWVAVELTPE